MDCAHGRAALRISNAERVFRYGRELGKHRWFARTDELRFGFGGQSNSRHQRKPFQVEQRSVESDGRVSEDSSGRRRFSGNQGSAIEAVGPVGRVFRYSSITFD